MNSNYSTREKIVRETSYPFGATIEEVVGELIRCKDCKYASFEPCKDYEDVYVCDRNYWTRAQGGNKPNDFCSHGERREK